MDEPYVRFCRDLAITFVAVHFICLPVGAQVSQETLNSISTPNTVETPIGMLEFLDGAPLPETAEKVCDYLDTVRGVDAFLKGMPGPLSGIRVSMGP